MKINSLRITGALLWCLGLFLLVSSMNVTAIARPRASWLLINDKQKACVNVTDLNGDLTTYYGVWIKGRWMNQITAGIDDASDGSVVTGDYLPIPPGSSDGVGSLAYVVLEIPRDTPLGQYRMSLWADDGTTRQRVPVMILVANDCGGY